MLSSRVKTNIEVEHLQRDLLNETRQLMEERRNILQEEVGFRSKPYKKLDLGQLFAGLSDTTQSKEQRMYHLTDKFQAYLKSLAQSEVSQRMRGDCKNQDSNPPVHQDLKSSQLRDSQCNEFLSKTLLTSPSNLKANSYQRQTKEKVEAFMKAQPYSYSRAESEETEIGKLKGIERPSSDSKWKDQILQNSQLQGTRPERENCANSKIQKSLYEQEKILLFNELNFYIRKYQYEKRQNDILMDHIDRMHAYISEEGILNRENKSKAQNRISSYSRKTQSKDSKKEDRLLQLLKLKDEEVLMEREKHKAFQLLHHEKNDRFAMFQEQIEGIRQGIESFIKRNVENEQRENQSSSEYHKMNIQMYQHQIFHLQNKILSLEKTAVEEERKKQTFFSDLVIFKDKMVSMDKENSILKSQIKKIQRKYQQLLDQKQSSKLGLNFVNGAGNYAFDCRDLNRQNNLMGGLKQQRCLNSQSRSDSKSRSIRSNSISSKRHQNFGLVSRDSTATDFERKSVAGADHPNYSHRPVEDEEPLYRSRSKELRNSLKSKRSSLSRSQKRVSFNELPKNNQSHLLYQKIANNI